MPESPPPSHDDFTRWSAYAERSKFVSTYTDLLKDADQRSINQVENFTKRIGNIYEGTLFGFGVAIIAVGIIFVISLVLVLSDSATTFQRNFGVAGLPLSLIFLLILIYRTPLKAARQVVGEVLKMQVIYLGYLRQINQIDIGFKQTFISTEKITPKKFQDTLNQTQQIIDNAIEDINLLLEEL